MINLLPLLIFAKLTIVLKKVLINGVKIMQCSFYDNNNTFAIILVNIIILIYFTLTLMNHFTVLTSKIKNTKLNI